MLAPGAYSGIGFCPTSTTSNDIDIYKVSVPAMSVVTVDLNFNHSAGDLDLYFSNGSLTTDGYISTYASSDSSTSGPEQILNETYPTATTVYIIVAAGTSNITNTTYGLNITVGPGVANRDCFTDCTAMSQLGGSQTWGSTQAIADGYYLYTALKYTYGRKYMNGLLKYATQEVKKKFPQTASDSIAMSDLSQADGKTPGVDVGSPRHPTTTHVNGRDVDVAYYQTDGKSNYQIICGAGTDTNGNGQTGTYNDGYFCTTNNNIVDMPRQVWFMAKLAESPWFRVVGIDQTLVTPIRAEALRLYNNGEIGITQYRRITTGLGYGSSGGWQFHHHHLHLSLYE